MYDNRIIYDLKGEYTNFGAVVHSIGELDRAIKGGCCRIVYKPTDLSPDHFDDVCEYIFLNLKSLVFVVDEVHKFVTKHKIPPAFNSLITVAQGEPSEIGVISLSQRPANVHNDILSSSSLIISFKLNLKTDADAVSKLTGIISEELQGLPYYHFYIYNDHVQDNSIVFCKPI